MQQDFAKRRGGKSKRRPASKSKRPKRGGGRAVAPNRYFHGPSFSGGVVLGAIVVIATAYLPEFLPNLLQRGVDLAERGAARTAAAIGDDSAEQPPATASVSAAAEPRPGLRFEFDELLSQSSVQSQPDAYYDPEQQRDAIPDTEILLQAASFRTQREANALRAELLLMDLPVDTASVELANGRWIRVTVGPFVSAVAANRAVTALREQAISPIWIERKAT